MNLAADPLDVSVVLAAYDKYVATSALFFAVDSRKRRREEDSIFTAG